MIFAEKFMKSKKKLTEVVPGAPRSATSNLSFLESFSEGEGAEQGTVREHAVPSDGGPQETLPGNRNRH